MQRTAVSSSNLASVGYNEASRILEVEFLDGRVYRYSGVPQEEHLGLMGADSHGKYFNAHIKDGGYSYRRLR